MSGERSTVVSPVSMTATNPLSSGSSILSSPSRLREGRASGDGRACAQPSPALRGRLSQRESEAERLGASDGPASHQFEGQRPGHYLAQPEGLGLGECDLLEGPKARTVIGNRRDSGKLVGPLAFEELSARQDPGLQPGLGKDRAVGPEEPGSLRAYAGVRFAQPSLLEGHRMRCWAFIAVLLCCVLSLQTTTAQEEPLRPASEQFVPADQLDAILKNSPSGVLMPKAEFETLLLKAQEASGQKSPAKIAIQSATYRITANEASAIVELELNIRQFEAGWAKLNLPIGNLQPESATIDDTPAITGTEKGRNGNLIVLHQQPGEFTVKLVLSTDLTVSGTDQTATFATLQTAAATLEIACPAQRRVLIDGRQLQRPSELEQATTYSVPTGSRKEVRITWTANRSQQNSDDLVFAESAIRATLNSTGLKWTSETRLSVFGEKLDQLAATVPADLEITDVQSTGLEQWSLEDDPESEDSIRLNLVYRQPFDQDRLIRIQAVSTRTLAADSVEISVPNLEWNSMTAHTGQIAVQSESGQRLQTMPAAGVTRSSGSGNSSALLGNAVDVFDFWKQNFELNVSLRPKDRELFSTTQSLLQIDESTGRFVASVSIETLNEPLFECRLAVPAGWQIESVQTQRQGQGFGGGGASRVPWSVIDESTIRLELPRVVPAGGIVSLTIKATQTLENLDDGVTFELPTIQVQDSVQAQATYDVWKSDDLNITFPELTGLVPIADSAHSLKFEAQTAGYAGQLNVERRTSRLTTRSELRTWLDPDYVSTRIELTVDVVNGSTRSLTVKLPEDMGEDVRFKVESLQQVPGQQQQKIPSSLNIIEQTALDAEDGVRPFQLTFDRRFVGSVMLSAFHQTERSEDFAWNAPFARIDEASRQQGFVVFEAQPEQQLSIDDSAEFRGLSPADASLVPACDDESGRRVALVYRYVTADYDATVTASTFETQAVPSAICEQIANVVVVDEAGSVQRSATVTFQSSGVQTLRFRLPEGASLWSTVLNGEAVQVRRDAGDFLVAIPDDFDAASNGHELEILFESDSADVDEQSAQNSIVVMIDDQNGDAVDVGILEQTWSLRYPQSMALADVPQEFELESGRKTQGWIQTQLERMKGFRIPRTGTIVERAVPLALCLLAVFVVTVLITKRRWKTLGSLAVIGVILMSLTLGINDARQAAYETASKADSTEEFDALPDEPEMAGTEVDFYIDSNNAPAPGMGGFGGGGLGGGGIGGGGFGGGGLGGGGLGGGGLDGGIGGGPPPGSDAPMPQNSNGVIVGNSADPFTQPNDNTLGVGGAFSGGVQRNAQDLFFDGDADPSVADSPFGEVKRNSALLSVKVDVADPDRYQSATFRSLRSTTADQAFPVVLQSAGQRRALRLMTLSVVLLLCLMVARRSVAFRISLAGLLVLVAFVGSPLVPGRWQPILDGVLSGTLLGIAVWLFLGMTRLCAACCSGGWKAFGRRSKSVATATLLLTVLTSQSVVAQQQEAQAQASQQAEAQAPSSKPAPPDEFRPQVIRPYEPGQPELLADQVFLPKEQFLKLYRLANPDTLPSRASMTEPMVLAAYYKSQPAVQVSDESWIQPFEARYVIQSFQPKPQVVALPIQGVTLKSASLKESSAAVSASSNGGLQVQISEAGLQVLDVEFQIPISRQKETGEFELDLKPVSAGTLTFELPGDKLVAKRNGTDRGLRQDDQEVVLPIAGGGKLKLQWSPDRSWKSRNAIFHSDTKVALNISDAGLTTVAESTVQVRQGSVNQLTVAIPKDQTIRAIVGENVAGWQSDAGGESSKVQITFQQPITKQTTIRLNLFQQTTVDAEQSTVDVAVPRIDGATRDSGTVAVLADRSFDVRIQDLSSIIQIDRKSVKLPLNVGDASQRTVAAFRFTRQPAKVSLKVQRETMKRSFELVSAVQLDRDRQRWTSLLTIRPEGGALRDFSVGLPPEFLVLDVQANGMDDWYVVEAEDDATRRLVVQLESSRTGLVHAVIQGQTPRSDAANQPTALAAGVSVGDRIERLQGPTLSDTPSSDSAKFQSQLHVWLDGVSEIASIESDGWKRVPAGQAIPEAVRKLAAQRPAVSLTTDDAEAAAVSLNLRRAAPSLLPESVLVTNVTDTSLELSLALKWQISRAAGTDFSFSIPTALSDAFDFTVPGLRQLTQQTQDGRTQYTIQLQQPASKSLFVLGTATLPLPNDRQVAPFEVRFSVPDESEAMISGQTHYWVLVNQSDGLLQPVDANAVVQDVEASELKTQIPEGFLKQSVSIQRCRANGATPPWELTFPEAEQVTPAVVTLAEHRLILASDGSWKSHHLLQIRNEGRQFLPVVLPDDARFLSCLVKGRPSRIVNQQGQGGDRSLIPIPQSGQVATVFEVEFLLAGQLSLKPANLAGQPVDLPLPSFPEFRNDQEYGITVARNTVTVFTPESWHASMVDDPGQTNVIPAGSEELEDAKLLTAVDNLKKMMESADSSNDNFQNQALQSQLIEQRNVLDSLLGNTIDASSQRDVLIRDFDDFAATNDIQFGGSGLGGSINFRSTNDGMGNMILNEMERSQNRFNQFNNSQLIMSNGGVGIQADPQLGQTFNFVLPEAAEASQMKRLPESKAVPQRKGQSKAEQSSGGSGGRQRSQLMQRRSKSAAPQQPPLPSFGRGSGGRGRGNDFPDPTDPRHQMQQQADFGDFNDPMPNEALAEFDELEQSVQTTAVGLLSLDFELPTAGNESSYLRTGGNPKLRLRVRSANEVSKAWGWLAAGIASVVFLVLVRGLKSDPVSGVRRLLVLATLIAFVGAVLLPGDLRVTCAWATVVLAGLLAATVIYRAWSLRRIATVH